MARDSHEQTVYTRLEKAADDSGVSDMLAAEKEFDEVMSAEESDQDDSPVRTIASNTTG